MLVSSNTVLTYTNERGLSMELSAMHEYFLDTVEETVETDLLSQKSRGIDGEHFDGSTLGARHITISGFLKPILNRRNMDRTIKRVFNATISGTLSYRGEIQSDIFTIDCRPEKVPDVIFDSGAVYFTIYLKCFDPFWHGQRVIENISVVKKTGRFPLIMTQGQKFVFGYRESTLRKTFENNGDAATGAIYTIFADGGPVTNPMIVNENNGYGIKVFQTINNGEKIIITSKPDYAGVTIQRIDGSKENGMPFLTDDTKRNFFLLDLGKNTISYTADGNAMNLSVQVAYTPLYLGVV